MNILILAHGTLSVAHQELVIAAAIKSEGHQVQITHDINFGIFNKGFIPEPLTKEDIIPHIHGKFDDLRVKIEPDIILGMDQSLAPVALAAKEHGNKPALCMFLDFPKHVIDIGSPVDHNPEYGNRYYSWLHAGLKLDSIIFNNNVACEEIKLRDNRDTELVWYPLCNFEDIKKVKKSVNEEDPYIASCHRFVAYKGTDYLIKALYGIDVKYKAMSVSGNIEKQVSAFGSSTLGDKFQHIVQAPEKLKLKVIADAMAFCYPQITDWVGGLSPLEAMALRTPTIVFDYPVLREIYEDCVIYVKPKDIDDLQDKIISVLNGDFDDSIIDRAEKRMHEFFTPKRMAQELIKVMKKYL